MRTLVWFRSDCRLEDNPALHFALKESGNDIVAVYLLAGKQWQQHDWGARRAAWLLHHIEALGRTLAERGISLRIVSAPLFADAPQALLRVMREEACEACFWNEECEWNENLRDQNVAQALQEQGLHTAQFNEQCLLPPGSVLTGSGTFYTVFTPFKRRCAEQLADNGVQVALAAPRRRAGVEGIRTDPIPDTVGPYKNWRQTDLAEWPIGTKSARNALRDFSVDIIQDYQTDRDIPAIDGTSSLSPYLAVGAISAGSCLRTALSCNDGRILDGQAGPTCWISELLWREFYRHILVGYPRVSRGMAFQKHTEALAWREDDKAEQAWQAGRTGIPIIDAAMRQLHETGWMHNRLRMIVAMFFTKNLLLDWRRGERYFMQQLIDADLASNNGGWQWSASTGTDAAPYFRIFNPYSQSKRFDPDGEFIRSWIPELAELDNKAIHNPDGKVSGYPAPIVDCSKTRQRAIDTFKSLSANTLTTGS